MNLPTCIAAFVLLSSATTARAAGWTDTFTPEALSAQALGGNSTLVLAAAGPLTVSLTSAERALRAALSNKGKVSFKDLGTADLRTADDPSIVALSRTVGSVDAVVILRVFEGAPATAVVSVFAQDGSLDRAFTATEGTPLPASDDKSGRGVTEEQMKRVDELAGRDKKEPPARTENQRLYERESIVVGTKYSFMYDAYAGPMIVGQTGIYQDGQRLGSEPDIYRALGRVDLVEAYESAETTKSIVQWSGIGVMVVGVTMITMHVTAVDNATSFSDMGEPEKKDDTLLIAGCVTAGVGTIAYLAGMAIDPSQATPYELRTMINGHNDGLRKKYGITSDEAAAPDFAPRLQLLASHELVGLQLSGSF